MYIKSLYKQKAEGQTRQDEINRKLAFKLPIVFRYAVVGSLFTASIHSFMRRKVLFGRYMIFATPVMMIGLCYDEITELWAISKENRSK